MIVLMGQGNLIEETVSRLDRERLVANHSNFVLFEHLPGPDLTLVFLKDYPSNDQELYAQSLLGSSDFMAIEGYVLPVSKRLFLFPNLYRFLEFQEKLPPEFSGSYVGSDGSYTLSTRAIQGIFTVLYSAEARRFPAEYKAVAEAHGGYEVFQDLRVPGDCLDLGRPKYQVSIIKTWAWSPTHFSTVDEIQQILRELRWTSVCACHVSLSDEMVSIGGTERPVEAITLPFLMAAGSIGRA